MEKFFRYLGHKAGPSIRKGKWIYHSLFADKDTAIESEYLVGKELAVKIAQQYSYFEDVNAVRQITGIHRRLTDCLTNKKRRFQITLIISPDINAFALPGGFIFMTDNLLRLLDFNTDRIAYVAAHEMTHVILKHPLNLMMSNFSVDMIEKFIRTKGAIGGFAKQAISGFIRNGYSQDKELEADKYAAQLMSLARYNPAAAIETLNLLDKNKDDQPDILNYFSTHPPVGDRIQVIKEFLKTHP